MKAPLYIVLDHVYVVCYLFDCLCVSGAPFDVPDNSDDEQDVHHQDGRPGSSTDPLPAGLLVSPAGGNPVNAEGAL